MVRFGAIGIRSALIVALGFSLAFSGAAAADDDARDEAKAHADLARVLYKKGDAAGALVEFKRAYALAPVPPLLFNIARCQEALGDLAGALSSYRAYAATHDKDAADARQHIEDLERRVTPGAQLGAVAAPRRTPIYRRWWLWTPIAVVVAGGVTAGVVLGLRAREAPHLTFGAVTPQ